MAGLTRLTKRPIPDFLTQDPDTAQFMQALIDGQAAAAAAAAGVTTFQALTDAFTFPGHSLQSVRVNAAETALEAFAAAASATSFTSTDQVIARPTAITIAHGLGSAQLDMTIFLVCQTTEAGWAVGDLVEIGSGVMSHTTGGVTYFYGCSVGADATNITLTIHTGRTAIVGFVIGNKSTGAGTEITDANWKIRVVAKL